MTQRESNLTKAFIAQRDETRAILRKHMEERGLLERDGWGISESTRQRDGKTELVMRPLHLHLPMPDDLECVVTIDQPGSSITTECDS